MQIELPQDIIERVQRRAACAQGATEADVIRKALDSLDWLDRERYAVQEGINAWRNGDVQDFDEFDRELRAEKDILADT